MKMRPGAINTLEQAHQIERKQSFNMQQNIFSNDRHSMNSDNLDSLGSSSFAHTRSEKRLQEAIGGNSQRSRQFKAPSVADRYAEQKKIDKGRRMQP